MSNLSRRAFLRGGAIAALGLAGFSSAGPEEEG